MKPIIFLVHGMGVHEDGWQDEIIAALDQIVADHAYKFFKNKPVQDVFEFVPLGYDNILRARLGRVEDAAALLKSLEPFSDEVADLGEWITKSGAGNKEYIWSHAMDVIFYRMHTPTRHLIRTTLVETIATKVDEVLRVAPNTPVSILAHSLGTAVAHDVAHLLGHHAWGGHPNAFGPGHWRFKSITMLANVSRLLESDIPVANSIVRPGRVDDTNSYCTAFLNYRHEVDPLTWPKVFSTEGFERARTDDRIVRHYHDYNVHGWAHYLRHPDVHIRFLREALGNNDAISPTEEITARLKFNKWGGRFAPIINKIDRIKTELHDDLASIGDLFGQNPSLRDIATALTMLQKTYDKYAKLIKELEALP